MIADTLLRTSARHITRHLPNVPLKHRIIAAVILSIGGLLLWYLTEREVYYKVFEFSIAPFVDKLMFEFGITGD